MTGAARWGRYLDGSPQAALIRKFCRLAVIVLFILSVVDIFRLLAAAVVVTLLVAVAVAIAVAVAVVVSVSAAVRYQWR